MEAPKRKRLSKKQIAAFVLIESGIRDLTIIAAAVGLSKGKVAEIISTTDAHLRRQTINGIAPDFTFSLHDAVRCPGCRHRITVAPCITCRLYRAFGPGS